MKSALIYLDLDPLPARRAEFVRVAHREHQVLDAIGPYPAHTGGRLLELAHRAELDLVASGLPAEGSLEHLAIVAHGSTTGILRPGSGHGVHVWRSRPPREVSVHQFARTWAPLLADGALLSLCACLCGRSPAWYLRLRFGSIPSSWGPRSYRTGGERSFASRLRDAFSSIDKPVRIRAHTVVGHVTASPMLREFGPAAGEPGETLFGRALPGVEPTLSVRRRWVRLVRGQLARDWLMGVPDVVSRVRSAW